MERPLSDRVREHAALLDRAAPPIGLPDVQGVVLRRRAPRPQRHRPVAVAAAAVVVVGGLVGLAQLRVSDSAGSADTDTISSVTAPTTLLTTPPISDGPDGPEGGLGQAGLDDAAGPEGLVVTDPGGDESYGHNTLSRVDNASAAGAYTVVLRHRDGSLVDRTATITYEPDEGAGDESVQVASSTGVATLRIPRGAGRVVVRALGLDTDQLTAVAAATRVVEGRPVIGSSPALSDFAVVAAGSQRPPTISEARYGCDALGESEALGALCYTGLTTSPGFEASLLAGDFRPGPEVNGRSTVVSAVGGGNGTLAWEPSPGVIAFVGYSGNVLGDDQTAALARLARRTIVVSPDAWEATVPQVVEQRNEW
jgi:hypothetical protein